eukprot:TRINITY_DN6398_c0_g1_i1.p1 TRINITY_DN6398_c0_g1~~TRINITY_DN6398_c0_g1_i1.p1  ORF type:complete len:822 (-),score=174.56 TRINITY_DN6398_c0_g1_i1:21-2486(-)
MSGATPPSYSPVGGDVAELRNHSSEIELSAEEQLMQSLTYIEKSFPAFYTISSEDDLVAPSMLHCLDVLLRSLNTLQSTWVPNSCPCTPPAVPAPAAEQGDAAVPLQPSPNCQAGFFRAAGVGLESVLLRYFQSISFVGEDTIAFAPRPRRKSDTPMHSDAFGSSRRSVSVSTSPSSADQKMSATATAAILQSIVSNQSAKSSSPTAGGDPANISNSLILTCLWLSARITKLKKFGVHESCKLNTGGATSRMAAGGTMSRAGTGTTSRSRSWSKTIRNTIRKTSSKRSLKNLLAGSSGSSADGDTSPPVVAASDSTTPYETLSEQILSQDSYSKRLAALRLLDQENFLAEACSVLLGDPADHAGIKFAQSLYSALFEIMMEEAPGEECRNSIQDLLTFKILLLILPNSSGLETDLSVVERLFLIFEYPENVQLVTRDTEWTFWLLQLILSQESPTMEEQKTVMPSSSSTIAAMLPPSQDISLKRMQSWQNALEDPTQDRVFRMRIQVVSRLIASSVYHEANNEVFVQHLANVSKLLRVSDDLMRLLYFASLNSFLSAKSFVPYSSEATSFMLRNLLDLLVSICEFMFFSATGNGSGNSESHNFSIHFDADTQFPDSIISGLTAEVIDKMIQKHFENEVASQITSDMGKIRTNLEQYRDLFQCADEFFDELQVQATAGTGVDMGSLQQLCSKLASKLAPIYAEDSILSFLDKKRKFSVKEKELDETIRLQTVYIFQNRLLMKGKRNYGSMRRPPPSAGGGGGRLSPSGSLSNVFAPSEGVFQEQRSDLSTRIVMAHNLVRQKMGKKALFPKTATSEDSKSSQ